MEWSEEQAAAAERKVQENSTQRVCQEKQGAPRWAHSGIDSQRTAGRAFPERPENRGCRVFVSGLIQNSGVEREWKGMGKDGKGLRVKILLRRRACSGFGFGFLFGRG